MSSQVESVYPIFNNTDGSPLEDGYIYVGMYGLNPEILVNQLSVYWDESLTIPAAQPIRILGGYPVNTGTPGRLFVSETQYSLTVRNKNSTLVHSELSVDDPESTLRADFANTSNLAKGAALVGQSIQVITSKANAKTITPVITRQLWMDGSYWYAVTGAAPSTYADDAGGSIYGTVIIPTSGDGSTAWLRRYFGPILAEWFYDGTDIGAAVNAAYATTAKTVILPIGINMPLLTKITRPDSTHLIGPGRNACSMQKQADVVGIEVATGGFGSLQGFTLTSNGVDTTNGVGILGTDLSRTFIDDVNINSCGSHGIQYTKGNLIHLGHVELVSNGGHGFYSEGTDPNTNGGIVDFLDSRGNTLDGFHLDGPWSESWSGTIFCQSNGGNGAYFNTTASKFKVYSESNGGNQVELGTTADSCVIDSLLSTVVNNATVVTNIVFEDFSGKGTQGISQVRINELLVTDGILAGTWKHTVTNTRECTVSVDSSGNATFIITHEDYPTRLTTFRVNGYISSTNEIYPQNTNAGIFAGTGSPEGAVAASPGAIYLNNSGGVGTSLYVKESGAGNTGWVGK